MGKFLLRLTLVMTALVITSGAWADNLTSGYYKIKNTGYSRYMCEDFTSKIVSTSPTCADTDYEKMWKVTVGTSGGVTLQNVYTGHYIQSVSGNSSSFTTGSSSSNFTTTDKGTGYLLYSGNYMHCAASQSYNVVGWWDSSSAYSIWSFESVSLTDTEVDAIRKDFASSDDINSNASTYNSKLTTFFTDLSCSQLNSTYSGYTETNLKTAMANAGLPTALQNVGASVLNQWSGETDPAIVKQFRVQNYSPYTRASAAQSKLNATQFNDMSNPTGIYADSKKDVIVFVGGAIPSGCELRLAGGVANNLVSYTSGTVLKQGVNAIKVASNLTQLWIMYTYTSDTQVDMSTLSALKIHIEGGSVLGYVNAADKTETEINTEYKKILTHANTIATENSISTSGINLIVKGNRGVFMFPLSTYNQIWAGTNYGGNTYNTYSIGKSIDFFDSVLKWEWSVMGHMKRVVDGECDPTKNSSTHENLTGGNSLYPTYYNNLALTLQGASGTNPYSTTGYTSMPGVGGVESSYNAERVNFDNWCVGHESGHNNQGLINLPSSTESSNNLFSNVIQYQWGYRMSRGATIADANNYYLNGTQFALRDIGTTHRMYWQLYLYYHMAKNNTSFYPTLFNLLRSDALVLSQGTCFTKFYEKACEAAGEDLTTFFTVWGFLQPFENVTFGDYTSHTLTLTQTEIDAAKARVKAKVTAGTYKKDNQQIIFIEDRTETAKRWDPFSTGTEQKVSSDGDAVTAAGLASTYGTMGSVSSMTSGSQSSTAGSCVFSFVDGKLTLTGTAPSAGVIVYDASGNIVAYGNTTTINIPSDVTDYSQLSVKAVASDGTTAEVKSVVDGGTDAQKLAVLQSEITDANALLALSDDTGRKVGYYKSASLADLKTMVSEAQTVVSNKTAASYSTYITRITAEIAKVKADGDMVIGIVTGNKYSILNRSYNRYAGISSKALVTNTRTTLTDADKWQFVPTGSGSYYIYNVSSKTYVSYSATSTQLQANATTTDGTATESTTDVAYTYNVVSNGDGTFYLQANEAAGYKCWHSASNDSYKVVGWTANAEASQWYITCTDEAEESVARAELTSAVTKAQALLDKVATNFTAAGTETPVTLTDSQISSNHKETKEGSYAGMIDDDLATYFHSTWSEATTDLHYWQVDLGQDALIDQFNFSMTSRNAGTWSGGGNPNNFPSDITIAGSNDGLAFTDIANVTNSCASIGQVSWTSETLGTSGTKYRYIRFTVNKTTSGNTGCTVSHAYYYFALAEFSMKRIYTQLGYDAKTGYNYVNPTSVTDLYNEISTAQGVLDSSSAELADIKQEITTLNTATGNLGTAMGDVNADGSINAADQASLISRLKTGTTEKYHDYNQDGSINASDATRLSEILLKKVN